MYALKEPISEQSHSIDLVVDNDAPMWCIIGAFAVYQFVLSGLLRNVSWVVDGTADSYWVRVHVKEVTSDVWPDNNPTRSPAITHGP